MNSVPPNYPYGSSNEEIQSAVKGLSDAIMQSGGNINIVMQFAPLVQLGQNELQKRLIDTNAQSTNRAEKIAITIAVTSILLSLITLLLGYKSDQHWQSAELKLLSEIKNSARTR